MYLLCISLITFCMLCQLPFLEFSGSKEIWIYSDGSFVFIFQAIYYFLLFICGLGKPGEKTMNNKPLDSEVQGP